MPEDDKNNHLTQEDSELWKEITKDDRKLLGKEYQDPSVPAEGEEQPIIEEIIEKTPKIISKKSREYSYLQIGDTSGTDGRTAEKLRKGKIKIEAKLDLHGCKQDEALEAVQNFINESYDKGMRCLLIITGKGTFKEGGGVLRKNLPHWLNAPSTRSKILMYTYARGEHGGEGAVYIYLRKNS